MSRALVFGCRGQLGHYLCAYLKAKGYFVVGTTSALLDAQRLMFDSADGEVPIEKAREAILCDVLVLGINFLSADLAEDLKGVLHAHGPFDEIYNLAGLLRVPASWKDPQAYMQVNGLAVDTLLSAVLQCPTPLPSVFIAGSAEVFGNQLADLPTQQPYRRSTDIAPLVLTEQSPRCPQSPYGLSKFVAEATARMYREKYRMCVSTGIFFNMESPRRAPDFFARKVALEASRVARNAHAGKPIKPIEFADQLTAVRDWGLASEYAAAVWQMTAAPSTEYGASDYIICSGHFATCFDFATAAVEAALAEVNIVWPRQVIQRDVFSVPLSAGPASIMRGSNTKFRRAFGWAPSLGYRNVVRELVHAELAGGPWEHPPAGVGI